MYLKPICVALCLAAPLAQANEYADQLNDLAQAQLMEWTAHPAIIAAVRKQNEAHAGLSGTDIDSLDKQWRAEVGASDTPLISEVMNRDVSAHLRSEKDATEGMITEVFVMDNHGLNVGQSDVTSDYWQGDEAKWSDSFGAGAGSVHIGDVELDESTQSFQSQVSLAITDPDTGAPIGAITFGIDLEMLE